MSKESELAFCLYGDFLWPPAPPNAGVSRDESNTASGCVLIGFREENNKYHAWLEWVPKNELKSLGNFENYSPTSLLTGPTETVEQPAWKYFQHKKERRALWLYPTSNVRDTSGVSAEDKGEVHLVFAGAFLLEQFGFNYDSEQSRYMGTGTLERRWPLVRKFNFIQQKDFYSQLVVGQMPFDRGGHSHEYFNIFRFDIGLPIPFPSTIISGWSQQKVFPLCAIYESQLEIDNKNDPLRMFATELGIGEDGTEIIGKQLPGDKNHRFGDYGFARKKGKAEGLFASLKVNDEYYKYFPILPNALLKTVPLIEHFDRLGFYVPTKDQAAGLYKRWMVAERGSATPENISLSFLLIKDRYGLVYRIRQKVAAKSIFPEKGSYDIAFSGTGQLFLKFRNDLGEKWLNTNSQTILTEVEFSWNCTPIAPIKIFEAWCVHKLHKPLELSVAARLEWEEDKREIGTGALTDPEEASTTDLEIKPPSEEFALLDGAIKAIRAARLGLQQIEGAQPQSFFPELKLLDTDKGKAKFAVYPQDLNASIDEDGFVKWKNAPRFKPDEPHFRLSLAKDINASTSEAGKAPNQLKFSAWFPSLGDTDQLDSRKFNIRLTHDASAENGKGKEDGFAFFKISNDKDHINTNTDQKYTLGALSFEL